LNIGNKLSPLPIWRYTSKPSAIVQWRNSSKQHRILAKFYINNTLLIGSQTVKFQLNLQKQAIVTVAFVSSHQNSSVSGLCLLSTKTWNWGVLEWAAVVCFIRFY